MLCCHKSGWCAPAWPWPFLWCCCSIKSSAGLTAPKCPRGFSCRAGLIPGLETAWEHSMHGDLQFSARLSGKTFSMEVRVSPQPPPSCYACISDCVHLGFLVLHSCQLFICFPQHRGHPDLSWGLFLLDLYKPGCLGRLCPAAAFS